jgi:NADPH-dependent 2,4-dienoyl-CoA reductase/sulfur reductase-like enzyme
MSRENKAGISRSYLERADIVIVGNGIAGLTAAVEARRFTPDARIVIITDQCHPTINTPALKQFATGKLAREQLLAYPAGTEREQRIHVIQAHVESINAQEKYLCLDGGRGFGYGSLLIATGSRPNGLPASMPGRDFDGVLTLHRLPDYLDLRRRLGEIGQAVVIGGGVHAIETVMGLLSWGISVHWLVRSETVMPRVLDQPASSLVLEHIQRAGVKIYLETEVVGIVGRVGTVAGVITNHNQMIPCQLVLVCTGTRPNDALARRCTEPMLCKNGILVDDHLRTSVRDIYAAGDVAALKNPQTGSYEPRAQWYSAVLEARIAAAAMTGHEAKSSSFGVPWHATHLGELSMLTVGNPLRWSDEITPLTDSGKGSYHLMALAGDRLVGYLSLGPKQPDSLAIKRIIDEGLPVTAIKKALLKGTFDARAYFSQRRSEAAHDLLTTGKLPGLSPVVATGKLVTRVLPQTGQLPAAPIPMPGQRQQRQQQPAVQAQPMQPARSAAKLDHLPETGPLRTAAPVPVSNYVAPRPIIESEEISPFTGNLPAVAKPASSTNVAISTRLPQKQFQKPHAAPKGRSALKLLPASAKLPAINVNSRGKRPLRNLWSYSEKRSFQTRTGGR